MTLQHNSWHEFSLIFQSGLYRLKLELTQFYDEEYEQLDRLISTIEKKLYDNTGNPYMCFYLTPFRFELTQEGIVDFEMGRGDLSVQIPTSDFLPPLKELQEFLRNESPNSSRRFQKDPDEYPNHQ